MEGDQDHPSISVVIPTRNEAKNLPYVLPHIPAIVNEVILVDGHSKDDTVAIAQQLLPNIRVIQQNGKGKGDALRTAFAACTGDIIVTLDADGSSDPKEIARFVDALEWGYDFAKGSRFLTGADSSDISWVRWQGNKALCVLVNVLFGTRFTDLCYGYNAFWRRSLNGMTIEGGGFEIEAEMILRMHKAGLKIVEVPSHEYRRVFLSGGMRRLSLYLMQM
jgi:glycosyltransferase involved in cell wall biosynthesis